MTRIKHYSLTHPLSSGYITFVKRAVVFDEYIDPAGPVAVGAEVTLNFTVAPYPIRYKEARAASELIPGSTVVRVG